MATRPFRSTASYAAEQITRDAIPLFLNSRGYLVSRDHRKVTGSAQSQVVFATRPTGEEIKMRVRLCWRREEGKPQDRMYAAAQLRSTLVGNDWDKTMRHIVARDETEGITHALVVQRDGDEFVYAALIPLRHLVPIWQQQGSVSADLIASGSMGQITNNHAKNGSSPTIWLQDDRVPGAHAVPDVLWEWPGVENLVKLMPRGDVSADVDDTYDDCHGIDYSLGSDGAARKQVMRSEVKRDPKVRRAVVERAGGMCERPTCGATRGFSGFLDVHHILGVGTSDRPQNCVALCPNCHREAHFASNADAINAELLEFATRA
jgi:5-methylcytosine-specific restriction protein A